MGASVRSASFFGEISKYFSLRSWLILKKKNQVYLKHLSLNYDLFFGGVGVGLGSGILTSLSTPQASYGICSTQKQCAFVESSKICVYKNGF